MQETKTANHSPATTYRYVPVSADYHVAGILQALEVAKKSGLDSYRLRVQREIDSFELSHRFESDNALRCTLERGIMPSDALERAVLDALERGQDDAFRAACAALAQHRESLEALGLPKILTAAQLESMPQWQRIESPVAPKPDKRTRAAITACYRHMAITPEGLSNASAECGIAPNELGPLFWAHLRAEAMPLHRVQKPDRSFRTFDAALTYVRRTRHSFALYAHLGSGKNRHFLKPLAQEGKDRVWLATSLRALVEEQARELEATRYDDHPHVLRGSQRHVSTLHWLATAAGRDFAATFMGLLVIDESESAANLLFGDGKTLSVEARDAIINTLKSMKGRGVRFCLMDGDLSGAGRELARLLGCESIEVQEQRHRPPKVEIHIEQTRTDDKGKKQKSQTFDSEIKALLLRGEKVAFMTDSKELALSECRRLAGNLRAVAITSDSRHFEAEAAFLRDPESAMRELDFVSASPSLNFGVSVSDTSPHVFVNLSAGTLGAAQVWQLARRFRAPSGGLIRISVPAHYFKPRRDITRLDECISDYQRLFDTKDIGPNVMGPAHLAHAQAIEDRGPAYALAGFLACLGVEVSFHTDAPEADFEARADAKAARKELREEQVKAVSMAPHTPADKRAKLAGKPARSPVEIAQQKRAAIEESLAIDATDHEPDGTLPLEIVSQALYSALPDKAQRLSTILSLQEGYQLESGRAGRYAAEKAALVCDLVKDLSGPDGFDSARLARVVEQHADRFRLGYTDLTRPPSLCRSGEKKGQRIGLMKWLSALLCKWGMRLREVKRTSSKKHSSLRFYTIEAEPLAYHFAQKIMQKIACKNAQQNRPNSLKEIGKIDATSNTSALYIKQPHVALKKPRKVKPEKQLKKTLGEGKKAVKKVSTKPQKAAQGVGVTSERTRTTATPQKLALC